MVQAMRLTMAALVLCAAFVAPAVASRQLKQAGGIEFPGCSFLSDSVIARNPDYRALYNALQASGLNDTLSSLTSPYTIFAPTDYAFAEFLAAANITVEDALESSLNDIVLEAHIVPGVVSLVCSCPAPQAALDRLLSTNCISTWIFPAHADQHCAFTILKCDSNSYAIPVIPTHCWVAAD